MAAASPRPSAAAAWSLRDRHLRTLVQLCTIVQKETVPSFVYTVQSVSARGGSCEQGCQNAYKSGLPFRRDFFDFLYIIVKAIGTCMQIFRKIYHQKNQKLFI